MTCMCDESQRVMSLNGDKVVCVCGGEGGGGEGALGAVIQTLR